MSEENSMLRSRGCTLISISEDCRAHWYDDEEDLIVVDDYSSWDGETQTQTLTREQAQRLRDDLAAALRALDDEEQRTD